MGGVTQRLTLSKARWNTRSAVQALRHLPKASIFKPTFSQQYMTGLQHVPWHLEDPLSLLYSQIRRKAAERPRNGLWWCVAAPMGLSKSRVVRSWTRRRVEEAFKSALKLSGFDSTGVALEGPKGPGNDLQGSLRIILTMDAMSAPKSVLDSEALTLVDWLSAPTIRRMSIVQETRGLKGVLPVLSARPALGSVSRISFDTNSNMAALG